MAKNESIEEFYKRKVSWVPNDFRKNVGHFNIFKIEPQINGIGKPPPYQRRDYYKLSIVVGNNKIYYADKILEVKKQALILSNPFIPYKWDDLEKIERGYFCIFNEEFFRNYGKINEYSIFHPGENPVLELNDLEFEIVHNTFDKMFDEINSDYVHKYDVLRNYVLELLHFAMKKQPQIDTKKGSYKNASERISAMFIELLERQFPIDETHTKINLRSPSEFAKQLNIHVNHLNRALKLVLQKTTSQIISDRILIEAKVLLLNSKWNVSEIAHSLGFKETTHFNNSFKKQTKLSPTQFRVN